MSKLIPLRVTDVSVTSNPITEKSFVTCEPNVLGDYGSMRNTFLCTLAQSS